MAIEIDFILGETRSVHGTAGNFLGTNGQPVTITISSVTFTMQTSAGFLVVPTTSTGVNQDIATGTTVQVSYSINTSLFGAGTFNAVFSIVLTNGITVDVPILIVIKPYWQA